MVVFRGGVFVGGGSNRGGSWGGVRLVFRFELGFLAR